MQTHSGHLRTDNDETLDPRVLARSKRHSLILGLIFALILIALPTKHKASQSTGPHPEAIRTSAPGSTTGEQLQPLAPASSQPSPSTLRVTSTFSK